MIQTAFNSMIALMMAKFIINDLPHAAGFANTQSPSRKVIPSTFGVVNREQDAYDFLLPYLLSESEDIELAVDASLLDDYPGPTYGIYAPQYILIHIHVNPVAGEVIDSLGALAHEIGHHKTIGVVSAEDEEAQAKSIGRYLLGRWLSR